MQIFCRLIIPLCVCLGCKSDQTPHDRAPAFSDTLAPVVQLTSRSTMAFEQKQHRAYATGVLVSQVDGVELTRKVPENEITNLVTKLQSLGFFELSESGIRTRINQVSEETGRHLAVSDYGTDTLTVRYQDQENTVSWRAIQSYVAAFPEVDELRRLHQCFQAARGTLIETRRP